MIEDIDFLSTGVAIGIVSMMMIICLGICIIGVTSKIASYHINTVTEINLGQGNEYTRNMYRSNKIHVQNLYEKKYPNAIKI